MKRLRPALLTPALLLALPLVLPLAAGSCGGGDTAPKPLRYHFDDMYIAAVPIEEKQAIFQAQQEYAIARAEAAKAESDYNESGVQLDVARNERKQALLEEQSAQRRKKAADDSGDMNRVNAATRELRGAELARKAADEKVDYVRRHREYLKKNIRFTKEQMYAKEAAFELAEARLAQQRNIRPKDFNLKAFDEQAKDRARRAQRVRAEVDRERQKSEEARKRWQGLQKEADRMRGKDPASPAAGTTAPEAGDRSGGALTR
jgi:hypothetical protein